MGTTSSPYAGPTAKTMQAVILVKFEVRHIALKEIILGA
jgi:hypothetical protein